MDWNAEMVRIWLNRLMMTLLLLGTATGVGVLHMERMLLQLTRDVKVHISREVFQAPVSWNSAEYHSVPFSFVLKGVTVGNPKGFGEGDAVRFKRIFCRISFWTIFNQVWTVDQFAMEGMHMAWQGSFRGSNTSALRRNVNDYLQQDGGSTPFEKKVILKELKLDTVYLTLGLSSLQGRAVRVALPPVVHRDVGMEEGGVPVNDVISMIAAPLFRGLAQTTAAVGVGTVVGGPVCGAAAVPVVHGARRAGSAIRNGVRSFWARLLGRSESEE